MLGFGELLAHEFAFRLGWSQTNVSPQLAMMIIFIDAKFVRCSPSIEARDRPGLVLKSEMTPLKEEDVTKHLTQISRLQPPLNRTDRLSNNLCICAALP